MTRKQVLLICLAVFALIMGWDIWLYSDSVSGNSITQTVIAYTKQSSLFTAVLGFAFGFLFAHFFDTDSQE